MKKIPVILDTDIGSDIDDTWALAALLNSPELDLRLVTTTSGDTRYRARLTAKFLEVAGHADIPVGIGIFHGTMEDRHRHQGPWMEDYQLEDYPGKIEAAGVEALIQTVRESPEPVTLISIAPCFNIARALELYPELPRHCHFVGMHGSLREGYGPGSPPEPETNVRVDVPGFRKVLAADWLSFRITPLDTCGRVTLKGDNYRRLRKSRLPIPVACMENYRIWAQRVDWMEVDFFEERTSTLFDNVAVTMAYTDAFFEYERLPIRCDDKGMTVEDPAGRTVNVAIRWKAQAAFENHITDRILNEGIH